MKRINFETAKLANEAGYKLKGFVSGYAKLDKEFFDFIIIGHEDFYAAPYQAELQKWLRDEHKLNVIVDFYDNSKYYGYESVVYDSKNREFHDEDMTDQAKPHHIDGIFDTYENALEEGLVQALKIVINENNTSSSNSNKM